VRGERLNGPRTEWGGSVVGGTSRSGNSAQIIKTYFTIIALLISFTHTHILARAYKTSFVCVFVLTLFIYVYTYFYRQLCTTAARVWVSQTAGPFIQWTTCGFRILLPIPIKTLIEYDVITYYTIWRYILYVDCIIPLRGRKNTVNEIGNTRVHCLYFIYTYKVHFRSS